MEILSAQHVSFTYPDALSKVVNNVDFTIEKGEFIVLCGASGSGKTTLLRLLKQEIAPHGKLQGTINYKGQRLEEVDKLKKLKKAAGIGMVFQDPNNQIVMDNVLQELLFGLENMGLSTNEMRKKVAEMIHFFGLNHLLDRNTADLSGGEKQLINLASVVLMEPELLLLDEPTSQLDPIAAKEFIRLLQRLNNDFGITIIIVEHRLEELFALADKVMLLEKGELVCWTDPKKAVAELYQSIPEFLPGTALLYLEYEKNIQYDGIPLHVKDAKQWVSKLEVTQTEELEHPGSSEIFMEFNEIDFQYAKDLPPVLQNLSLTINKGEWHAIVGANGTGKSTLLKVIGGILKPQHGRIKKNGKKVKSLDATAIGYLPQNPKLYFVCDSIMEEYRNLARNHHIPNPEMKIQYILDKFQISDLQQRHPYDLSGGEIQKAALAGTLLTSPSMLLIDEPTKGLDPNSKRAFGELIQSLVDDGLTVVMVTHDIEFAARYTSRCSMLFQKDIIVSENARAFFQGNTYYTTVMNRITRNNNVPAVITLEEAKKKWRLHEYSL